MIQEQALDLIFEVGWLTDYGIFCKRQLSVSAMLTEKHERHSGLCLQYSFFLVSQQ